MSDDFRRVTTTQIIRELVARGFDVAVTSDGVQIYDSDGRQLIG